MPAPSATPNRLRFVLNIGKAPVKAPANVAWGGFLGPESFEDRVARKIRLWGDGANNPEFDAFFDKCMVYQAELQRAMDDYYNTADLGETESYPVEDAFKMLKQLFNQGRGVLNVNSDMAALNKAVWLPGDVLNLLCHVSTQVNLLGYGRFGVTFDVLNPLVSATPFVFKISVGLQEHITQFYGIANHVQNFAHQRATVQYGSLEQYMQNMGWVQKPNPVFDFVPRVQLVDNSQLTLPCTLLVMEKVAGSNGPMPAWAVALGFNLRVLVAPLDAQLKSVGVNHGDLKDHGNVLVDWIEGPPPQAVVKIIDFGQAMPSGTVALRVGQA